MARVQSIMDPQARDVTAAALHQTLVDLIDLGLVAKEAHWTVTGPRFRALHRQLDEVADAARRHGRWTRRRDRVSAHGRAATVATGSRLPAAAAAGSTTAMSSATSSTSTPS